MIEYYIILITFYFFSFISLASEIPREYLTRDVICIMFFSFMFYLLLGLYLNFLHHIVQNSYS